jgi:hypothetical protein
LDYAYSVLESRSQIISKHPLQGFSQRTHFSRKRSKDFLFQFFPLLRGCLWFHFSFSYGLCLFGRLL